jgi:hypothetical protein
MERKFWRLGDIDHDVIMNYAGFKKGKNGLWVLQ